LIKQRWVIDVQAGLSATFLVFRPAGLAADEKRPAILCCHGHGPHGKNTYMGLAPNVEPAKCFGLQMAKAGFVTYSLDWLGFGERNAQAKPHYSSAVNMDGYMPRDACNIYYLCETLLGSCVLASNLHDARVVTDCVASLPFVDGARLGVMGQSLGGTMTTWVMATDERFRAADVICYAGTFREIAFRTYNVCGSQVAPGLMALVDVGDLQGLIAPRPLLLEVGIHDTCFQIDDARESCRQTERVYQAAGAALNFEMDVFPGGHTWGGNKSRAFFRKHLAAGW
jgi:dienelactone hydrolase